MVFVKEKERIDELARPGDAPFHFEAESVRAQGFVRVGAALREKENQNVERLIYRYEKLFCAVKNPS